MFLLKSNFCPASRGKVYELVISIFPDETFLVESTLRPLNLFSCFPPPQATHSWGEVSWSRWRITDPARLLEFTWGLKPGANQQRNVHCSVREGAGNICPHPSPLSPSFSLSLHCERSRRRLLGGSIWRGNPLLPPFSKAPYLNHCTLMFSYLKFSFFFYNAKMCEYIVAYIMCRIFVWIYIREVETERFPPYQTWRLRKLLGRYKLSISPKRQTLLYFCSW